MNNVTEIIEEIKNIISVDIEKKEGKSRKIKDRDVAIALNVEPLNLASAKFRGKIFFKEIIEFCASKGICINTLLYSQSVKFLEKNTDKYLFYKYCLTH